MARKAPARRPGATWKTHLAATLQPKIAFGGIGIAALTWLGSLASGVLEHAESAKPQSAPQTTMVSAQSTASAKAAFEPTISAVLTDAFPTVAGLRARLVLTADRKNENNITVTAIKVATEQLGQGQIDTSDLRNQGQAPISSALVIYGEPDRAYWISGEGHCTRAHQWPSNLLDIPAPPLVISLAPGEQYVLVVELLSERAGRFRSAVSVNWQGADGTARSTLVQSDDWSAIGDRLHEPSSCRA